MFPWNMVIFHRYVSHYQRVHFVTLLVPWSCPLPMVWLSLGENWWVFPHVWYVMLEIPLGQKTSGKPPAQGAIAAWWSLASGLGAFLSLELVLWAFTEPNGVNSIRMARRRWITIFVGNTRWIHGWVGFRTNVRWCPPQIGRSPRIDDLWYTYFGWSCGLKRESSYARRNVFGGNDRWRLSMGKSLERPFGIDVTHCHLLAFAVISCDLFSLNVLHLLSSFHLPYLPF